MADMNDLPHQGEAIAESAGIDDEELEEFLDSLDKDGSPTAHLFKCSKCGKFGGDHDFD